MSELLRVGIAGFGVVGKRRREFIEKHPNLKIVGVCDRRFNNPGIFDDGIKFFPNYKDLLTENLDILFVCLTNDIAAEVTMAGLNNGFHVFCEKPPGRNLDDIANVMAVEKQNPHLKLMYGFNHRHHDSVKKALELVKTGEMGNIINLRGVYGKSKMISFRSDWRTKRAEAGGGILLDQGIHMVDLLRLFAGDFNEVHSFVHNDYWNHDVEDNAYALMRTPSGVVAFMHSTATEWRHRFHLDIAFEYGSITLSGILSGTKSYGSETIRIAKKSDHDQGDPSEMLLTYNEDPSWKSEIWDFTETILKDKPVLSGSSQDAYKTMELVYKIYCADPAWKKRFDLSDKPSIDLHHLQSPLDFLNNVRPGPR